MVSFDRTVPFGFEVEVGWGGGAVNDATWQVQQPKGGRMWGHRPVSTPERVTSGNEDE